MGGKMPGIAQDSLLEALEAVVQVSNSFVPEAVYLHDVGKWMPEEPVLPSLKGPLLLVTDAGRTVGAWRVAGDDLVECFRFDRHGNPSKKEVHGTFLASQVRITKEHPEGEVLDCTIVEVPRDLHLNTPRQGVQTSIRTPEDRDSKSHFQKMRQWVQVCSQVLSELEDAPDLTVGLKN